MIVPDINLLLYAYNDGAQQHESARLWWEGSVNGDESVGIPWIVLTGFVRLITNPRVLSSPATPAEAIGYVQDWLQYPHIIPLNPGDEHLTLLRRILEAVGTGANLVTDAHIAALAMENQAEVHSNDSDFARFPGLRWRNPLVTFPPSV